MNDIHKRSIELTESASSRIISVLETSESNKFRVFVTGGGCSGFQYGFAFEEEQADGDMLLEAHGVTMMVDPMSFPYLMGSTVDYLEDLQGSRFVVSNPNAKSTCGCGSSFAV